MAGLRICRNFPLISKDKLTEDALGALSKGSGIPNPIFAIFCTFTLTPAPTQAVTPTQTFVLALSLPGMYIDVDLQKPTRLALEFFIKGQKYS